MRQAPVITKVFRWDAGHRVLGHEGKCKNVHGHSYKAEVSVTALEVDQIGVVIDFAVLKTLIGGFIDNNWDHKFMAHKDEPLQAVLSSSEVYVMGLGNPTAENIAEELFSISVQLLKQHHPNIRVENVRVWETPTCFADYPGGFGYTDDTYRTDEDEEEDEEGQEDEDEDAQGQEEEDEDETIPQEGKDYNKDCACLECQALQRKAERIKARMNQ